ncbi:hypothetical protein Pelo_9809 [Pelomyxa schiedti]|nr:hypothetical protein Pelo_9809 [Pelomyxa schiedti]
MSGGSSEREANNKEKEAVVGNPPENNEAAPTLCRPTIEGTLRPTTSGESWSSSSSTSSTTTMISASTQSGVDNDDRESEEEDENEDEEAEEGDEDDDGEYDMEDIGDRSLEMQLLWCHQMCAQKNQRIKEFAWYQALKAEREQNAKKKLELEEKLQYFMHEIAAMNEESSHLNKVVEQYKSEHQETTATLVGLIEKIKHVKPYSGHHDCRVQFTIENGVIKNATIMPATQAQTELSLEEQKLAILMQKRVDLQENLNTANNSIEGIDKSSIEALLSEHKAKMAEFTAAQDRIVSLEAHLHQLKEAVAAHKAATEIQVYIPPPSEQPPTLQAISRSDTPLANTTSFTPLAASLPHQDTRSSVPGQKVTQSSQLESPINTRSRLFSAFSRESRLGSATRFSLLQASTVGSPLTQPASSVSSISQPTIVTRLSSHVSCIAAVSMSSLWVACTMGIIKALSACSTIMKFQINSNSTLHAILPVDASIWLGTDQADIIIFKDLSHGSSLSGHKGPVLALLRIDNHVYSLSADKTIKVWKVKGKLVKTLEFKTQVRCMVLHNGWLWIGTDSDHLYHVEVKIQKKKKGVDHQLQTPVIGIVSVGTHFGLATQTAALHSVMLSKTHTIRMTAPHAHNGPVTFLTTVSSHDPLSEISSLQVYSGSSSGTVCAWETGFQCHQLFPHCVTPSTLCVECAQPITKEALKCKNCIYTVHTGCRRFSPSNACL